MRKGLVVTVLLVAANMCYASDTTTANFITQTYKQIINTSYRYYYIQNEAKSLIKNKAHFADIDFELTNAPQEVPIQDLKLNLQKDTAAFKWNDYPLPYARYVDEKSLPFYPFQNIILKYVPIATKASTIDSLWKKHIVAVPVSSGANEKQLKRAELKVMAAIRKKPEEEKNYYIIWKPVFSSDKRFALLAVDENGQGHTYIFKRDGNRWLIIYNKCWVA
ncbi:hypothetical protein [Mucilaginibacter sp. PAMB04168]|uniref:hypothetical protein n=1 Tax=Mucilaginibacter sp. PAMB04168 TaxID=3138567 RepID=UPI0031F71576